MDLSSTLLSVLQNLFSVTGVLKKPIILRIDFANSLKTGLAEDWEERSTKWGKRGIKGAKV